MDHVDVLHGVKVADPYRWLEDDIRDSAEVSSWVEAQNKVTHAFLAEIAERPAIRARLEELWNYPKAGAPFQAGGRYYQYRNSGLQNQSVLYTMDAPEEEGTILIDPNSWSEDGTIALAGTRFSDDGRYVAYGVAEAGSDWRTWRVMEIESRRILDDEIRWVKFGSPTWTPDSAGFFYCRYAEPQEGEKFQSLNLNQKLFYHRIGRQQAADVLVYQRPDQPEWGFSPDVTEDGRYLVITVWKGTDDKYRVLVRDLREPYALPVDLIDSFDHEFSLIGNEGPVLFFRTDVEAPRKRVIAIDLRQPGREHWREIIPQSDDTLTGVSLIGGQFVARYLRDARSEVRTFRLDGTPLRTVDLPGIGTAGGFSGRQTQTETFYSFSSFATPPEIYRYDLLTGESQRIRRAEVAFNPDDYEVKQEFYTSRDGTRVPMFIAHRRGLKLDGNNPTLLYGYGGFNISMTPGFSVSRLQWMEMGGVFAMPNLRGGGEYGEEWHRAGPGRNKQNVFDDFIAAAEWLIEHKYTSSRKLAIQGGSNGGLLVGACLTQRPDLFGACLPAVGVMDMLRFHRFTAGRFWVDDYGSPDDPEDFKALSAYSPYHNIRENEKYPPVLVTTADTDDRVVPGHSFKFAARLQAAQAGEAPVLIRIETKAGHGAGKPTSMVIDETADRWAFLVRTLGMKVPTASPAAEPQQ